MKERTPYVLISYLDGRGGVAFHCPNTYFRADGSLVMQEPIGMSNDGLEDTDGIFVDHLVINLTGLSVGFYTPEQWTARVERYKKAMEAEKEEQAKTIRTIFGREN